MKCWAVKSFTAKTVVNVVAHYGDLVLASPFFNHKPLIFYRPVGISVKNRQPDIAYSIFADRNSQFRMLSAFSCHDIHLPYTKRTMAQTIALEGIISCSVFHIHEDTLIFRFHELRHPYVKHKLKNLSDYWPDRLSAKDNPTRPVFLLSFRCFSALCQSAQKSFIFHSIFIWLSGNTLIRSISVFTSVSVNPSAPVISLAIDFSCDFVSLSICF